MEQQTGIQKIEKSKLVDMVISQMYRMLENGVWKEGDKLASENKLAQEFNVSRVVIREALQSLRSQNMITTRHGLGSFVCNPSNFLKDSSDQELLEISEDDFLSLSDLRACVENRAVLLSSKYGTEADFARIFDALQRMQNSVGNLEEFTRADLDFHTAVVESGHSRLLIKAYHSCRSELFFILKEMNRVPESQTYALSTHAEICQAIAARDPKWTLRIFKNMSKFNKVRYSSLFKETPHNPNSFGNCSGKPVSQ